MSEGPAVTDDVDELPEQLRVRRAKLDRLRDSGVDPYPVSVARTTTLEAVRAVTGWRLDPADESPAR